MSWVGPEEKAAGKQSPTYPKEIANFFLLHKL